MTTPKMRERPTPRTDQYYKDRPFSKEHRDFARQLEQENQELREALKELQGAGIKADFWMADHEHAELHKRGGSQNRQALLRALASARAALGEGA